MKYEIEEKRPTISRNNMSFHLIRDKHILNIFNDQNSIIKTLNIYSYHNGKSGLYCSIYLIVENEEMELIKQFLLSNNICFLYKVHNKSTFELRLNTHILLEFL